MQKIPVNNWQLFITNKQNSFKNDICIVTFISLIHEFLNATNCIVSFMHTITKNPLSHFCANENQY